MLKRTSLFIASMLVLGLNLSAHRGAESVSKSDKVSSPKMRSGENKPLLDFNFNADPTSVEYEGRLYVYGTNDHQQYDSVVGTDAKNNTYEKIKSLVMMSTDDMVNWTYHGLIDVGKISPWIMNSWAPSIAKRVEKDGKTHFYLYYSDSGRGVGVLTATSPVGPWSDPLGKEIVEQSTPGLGHCPAPFDPGVVIDDSGTGWLSFGGGAGDSDYMPGTNRIAKLGDDMISFDSEFVKIDAPYFFEASELNFINGTWVYTYNTNWVDRKEWHFDVDKPTTCSMCYFTTKTPLVRESWKFRHNYLKNPGDYGFDWGNNHTHLQKYKGKWYIIYHNMMLQDSFNTKLGVRSICIDEISVNEDSVDIKMGEMTRKGVEQLHPLNPYIRQQAETVAATEGVDFVNSDIPGNMYVRPADGECVTLVRGAGFDKSPKKFKALLSAKGEIEVRKGTPDGTLISAVKFDNDTLKPVSANLVSKPEGVTDICFVVKGDSVLFDEWTFE